MRENEYQAYLIRKLRGLFPECLIMKNDAGYIQGIPDLTILFQDKWAVLEVKPNPEARRSPNQEYYIDRLGEMSFAAFINPENELEVLSALQSAFSAGEPTRVSKR
jgi:hypothetical protein